MRVVRILARVEAPGGTRYTKSRLNQAREREALAFVAAAERRFQKPDRATKRRILELLKLPEGGEWTDQTFDLVLAPPDADRLTVANADELIDRLCVIEVKATKKPIRNTALNGFFFGTTDRQYQLARAAGNRYLYAFVGLNGDNEYGQPFYVLLTLDEVERRTQSKRLQYQVSFRRDIESAGERPSRIPAELRLQARAEVQESESP